MIFQALPSPRAHYRGQPGMVICPWQRICTGTWQPWGGYRHLAALRRVQAPGSPKGDGESTQVPGSPMRDSSICERSWSFHLATVIHSHLHRYIYLELWWKRFQKPNRGIKSRVIVHWSDLSSGLSFFWGATVHHSQFTEFTACQIFTKESWGHVRYSQRKVEGMSDICHHWRTH